MSNLPVSTTYPALREEILRILQEGKERARQAVEREKVQTYHEAGRILHEHLLANEGRADYGKRVVARLAEEAGIRERLLYEMMQFYRYFQILRAPAKLGWAHYSLLLSVSAKTEREFYERETGRLNWSTRELKAQIKAGAFAQAQNQIPEKTGSEQRAELLLRARRGRLYTYRTLAEESGGVRLDLGFNVHHALSLKEIEPPAPGSIVEAVRETEAPEGYRLRASRAGRDKLYTYRGTIEKVVDGDTMWVKIDCGFRTWTRQKLRLRGIDTPEMSTLAGRRARDFVAEALCEVPFVILTTAKSDKYDRYLSNIFYLPGERDPEVVVEDGIFLNQQLLDEGVGRRFEG